MRRHVAIHSVHSGYLDLMPRGVLVVVAALLLGIPIWLLGPWSPSLRSDAPHRSPSLAEPPSGGDFRLRSATGPVDLQDLRGQVVLIYFGYASCPDICPTNLAFIANALKSLTPAELERVRVLFVSVDPERDDLERLAEYAGYFHPRILGLTGSPSEIAAAARLYGAAYRRAESGSSAMGYTVDHSAFTYVVDPQGRLARTLPHATSSDRILGVIRELLAPAPGSEPESTHAGR